MSFTGLSGEPMPEPMIQSTSMDAPHEAGDDMFELLKISFSFPA
jgi:hypothetical protein